MGEGSRLRDETDAKVINNSDVLAGFVRELWVEPQIDADAVRFRFDQADYRSFIDCDGKLRLYSDLAVDSSYPRKRLNEVLREERGVRSGIALNLDAQRSFAENQSIIVLPLLKKRGLQA